MLLTSTQVVIGNQFVRNVSTRKLTGAIVTVCNKLFPLYKKMAPNENCWKISLTLSTEPRTDKWSLYTLVNKVKIFDVDFVFIEEFIWNDDACHLKKCAENSVRRNITRIAKKMAEMEMIVLVHGALRSSQ